MLDEPGREIDRLLKIVRGGVRKAGIDPELEAADGLWDEV